MDIQYGGCLFYSYIPKLYIGGQDTLPPNPKPHYSDPRIAIQLDFPAHVGAT